MKRNRFWFLILATLLALSLVLSACGQGKQDNTQPSQTGGNQEAATQPAADEPVDGGTLTFGTFSDISTLNPLLYNDTASGDLIQLIFAPLYNLDRTGSIVADEVSLAAELPEISADGTTYTIKLKENIHWSDGKPITADDVVFTYQSYANPDVASPAISLFDKMESVTKIDDRTVQIKLKQVYAPFGVDALNIAVVPKHAFDGIEPKAYKDSPYGKDPAKTITSGPFKWVEWRPNEYHTLVRDPNYWGPKPHIEKFIFKIYADQQTLVQALINGDVDMMTGIPVPQLEAVKAQPHITVLEQPGPFYDYLGFNFKDENFPQGKSPFHGVKTRQAIIHAINRKGMVDTVLKGHGGVLDGPFLPSGWAYTEGAAIHYEYNPEKAKQLLAEDGWKPGPDGILVKDGIRFEFTLTYNAGNTRREQMANIIQQNLAEVGIKVNIEPVEFSSLVENMANPGKYQTLLLGWQLSVDPDQESLFSSKYFPPNGQNSGFYKNEKLDELWVKGWSTTDQAERKKIYAEVAREISADPPYVFLAYRNELAGINKRVRFKEEHAPALSIPYGYLLYIHKWWVTDK